MQCFLFQVYRPLVALTVMLTYTLMMMRKQPFIEGERSQPLTVNYLYTWDHVVTVGNRTTEGHVLSGSVGQGK